MEYVYFTKIGIDLSNIMKAHIEWVEKIDVKIKKKIRITFIGKKQIKWQFKRSDQEKWDYDSKPTIEEWNYLEVKASALYQRKRISFENLQLIRNYLNKL